LSTLDAECPPNTRKQQSQIIEDLGRGGNSRTRIARSVLLADRDGGSNAINQIDIRLFNALQELP